MALALSHLSWWSWSGKDREATVPSGSHLNGSSESCLGMRELDTVKCSSVNRSNMHPTSRRVKRKWQSREERKIDREYDMVLVPSDGGCLSGSESDDSDWSVGWLEPHAPDFLNEDESERSFAVLVPCYGRGRGEPVQDPKNQLLGAIVSANPPNGFPAGSMSFMEEWLSSLKSS